MIKSLVQSFGKVNPSLVRNIIYGFGIRVLGIILQFLLVKISLNFVSPDYYGLWLTISTMVLWLGLFDLGLTNGLRNKISEKISINAMEEIGGLLRLSYRFLLFLTAGVFITGIALIFIVDWPSVIDIPKKISRTELLWVFVLPLICFCVNLYLKPIFALHYSLHNSYVESFSTTLASVLSLLLLLIGYMMDNASNIIWLAFSFSVPQTLVTAGITWNTFRKSPQYFQRQENRQNSMKFREISGLSLKYFFIQVSATVVHYYGNTLVTEYNLVVRYFSLPMIVFSIIINPFWNIVAEKVHARETEQLKMVFRKVRTILFLMLAALLLMILVSPIFFNFWVGESVSIQLSLIISYSFFTIISLVGSFYTLFINGSGNLKIQTITSVISSALYLPVMIFFITRFNFGLEQMVLFSTIWLALLLPVKYYQVAQIVHPKNKF
jgi:O-antigen/teichoic acid export membrane protein